MEAVTARPHVDVLGAGPHGRSIAAQLQRQGVAAALYDDQRDGYLPLRLSTQPWLVGAARPEVRRSIAWGQRRPPDRRGLWVATGAYVDDIDVHLGVHVHIGANAVVSHGCEVDDFTTIAAGVVLGGETSIGADVFIGANATVIHGGITVGSGALVAAGAVVVDDVEPEVVVAGNPARVISDMWSWQDMSHGRRGRPLVPNPG